MHFEDLKTACSSEFLANCVFTVCAVKDNYVYARVAKHLGDRTLVKDDQIEPLTEILGDDDVVSVSSGRAIICALQIYPPCCCLFRALQAKSIVAAAKTSMGMDISATDLSNVDMFTGRLVSLAKYRQQLHDYLHSKMRIVAPNLAALIGDSVGARLISHAGSLTNLAKCPASTVQILGAEKALFRALKTKGNTPKYGLIFHSTFIGRAGAKNKGRISRYLANKCSIASRIDSFSEKVGNPMHGIFYPRILLLLLRTISPRRRHPSLAIG